MKARAAAAAPPLARDVGAGMLTFCRSYAQDGNLDTKPVYDIHERVLSCVHEVDPATSLHVFGSVAVYGVYHKSSDVDLVALHSNDVLDGKGSDASTEVAKGIQSEYLSRLTQVMQRRHPTWQMDLVRRTRVPVLRVQGETSVPSSLSSSDSTTVTTTLVPFDVTAFRRNGVRNSALLRAYLSQCPTSRWLSIIVKRWSKLAGVNASVEGGCITSYGLNVMLAYYLLCRGLAGFVPPESCDVAHISPTPAFSPLIVPSQDGGAELGEMALDFLHFYLHEFDYDTQVVSLSRPGITTKEELQWTKQAEDMGIIRGEKVHYRWCIEDPYETNLNVGRNVTPFKQMLLKKHLERAVQMGLMCLPQPAQ